MNIPSILKLLTHHNELKIYLDTTTHKPDAIAATVAASSSQSPQQQQLSQQSTSKKPQTPVTSPLSVSTASNLASGDILSPTMTRDISAEFKKLTTDGAFSFRPNTRKIEIKRFQQLLEQNPLQAIVNPIQ